MRTAQPDKRTRLIETATKLAYGRGFRETSLADIAEAARVPVGNVYYYFKTKDELAEAVVAPHVSPLRHRKLHVFPLRHWHHLGRKIYIR
jgi:AcrR family transcriptional regulator